MTDFDAATSLQSLPYELKKRVVSWLCASDALSLSIVSRSIYSSLSLSATPSRIFHKRSDWKGHLLHGDIAKEAYLIPVSHRRALSVQVSFDWLDQGFGNRKSEVWIIGRPKSSSRDLEQRFDGGRVVWRSPVAGHERTHLTIEFSPLDGEMYHLWYKVGSGGGHTLTIHEASIRVLFFDYSDQKYYSKNFPMLLSCGAISRLDEQSTTTASPFFSELLVSACEFLLQAIRKNDLLGENAMALLFEKYNIEVTENSCLAVKEVIEDDLEMRRLMALDKMNRAEQYFYNHLQEFERLQDQLNAEIH